ncbi:helix-turn-helix domain-containing protein [Mucilaginibacter sp. PAMB04168]|uniref:TetR/AcrR family transcriptional regulator n=1 Tax=Mucilaginibacter sp. PAMB04168 TaxID=3138567 RepID=UPI0031F62967
MLPTTKQNIVDAAIFIFNEDLSAPLEKVADYAQVTRRTLHRYFTNRDELLHACQHTMQKQCNDAITAALNSSADPAKQLEHMLYAGIDCGVKYAFFNKLHHLHNHQHAHHNKECARYDATFGKVGALINKLQDDGVISKKLTAEWVSVLFTSVINATISTHEWKATGSDELKKFAWFSFSRGVGI